MKPRIYIETSVISYLAARPSREAVNAAHTPTPLLADNTLAELWAAKDATALLYRNASTYFAYLSEVSIAQVAKKPRSNHAKPITQKSTKQNRNALAT
jgi:hypothetical protein